MDAGEPMATGRTWSLGSLARNWPVPPAPARCSPTGYRKPRSQPRGRAGVLRTRCSHPGSGPHTALSPVGLSMGTGWGWWSLTGDLEGDSKCHR